MRFMLMLALILSAFPAFSQSVITGRAYVIDGDTLAVGNTRVRLAGIDAPESSQTCGNYACGAESKQYLKALIGQSPVYCEPDVNQGLSYGRVIANCSTREVQDLSRAMVQAGQAEAYTRYSREYVETQRYAQSNAVGVWQEGSQFQSAEQFRHGASAARQRFVDKNPATSMAVGSVVTVAKAALRAFGEKVSDHGVSGSYGASTYTAVDAHKSKYQQTQQVKKYSVLNEGAVGDSGLTREDLCQLAKLMNSPCR